MADTIRLNKVLRELNISIDRAVDFLESKGIEIEKSPNTKISEEVHVILSNEFQTDASKKVASKEVGEAKLKEKEVLREQRERELEEKHKEAAKKEEIIKASKTLAGPKQVGKIDLEPKKTIETPAVPKQADKEVSTHIEEVVPKTVETPPVKEASVKETPVDVPQVAQTEKKAETAKEEEKAEPVKPKDQPVSESKKEEVVSKSATTNNDGETIAEERVKTKYQKLTGPKIAGDKIDLSQFNKPKKKKEEKKK